MTTQQRNALERMVETFEQTSMLPEDLDLDSPEMKAMPGIADKDVAQIGSPYLVASSPDDQKFIVGDMVTGDDLADFSHLFAIIQAIVVGKVNETNKPTIMTPEGRPWQPGDKAFNAS